VLLNHSTLEQSTDRGEGYLSQLEIHGTLENRYPFPVTGNVDVKDEDTVCVVHRKPVAAATATLDQFTLTPCAQLPDTWD